MKSKAMRRKIKDGFAIIYTEEHGKFTTGSGLVSSYTWESSFMQTMLSKGFYCKDGEIISGIEVTSEGIKAHFEKVR